MVEAQYVLAWLVYWSSGAVCCFIWWRMTSHMGHRGWRDLARGFVVVFIFTPWYAGGSPEFFAPAIVVLLMDLFIVDAKAGMEGGVALLFSSFAMLVFLMLRAVFLRK